MKSYNKLEDLEEEKSFYDGFLGRDFAKRWSCMVFLLKLSCLLSMDLSILF